MTDSVFEKNDKNLKQMPQTFLFYSPTRGKEYEATDADVYGQEIKYNYVGSALSDGSPGGVAGDVTVRPELHDRYKLLGVITPFGIVPVAAVNGVIHEMIPEDLLPKEKKEAGPVPVPAPAPAMPGAKQQKLLPPHKQ